MSHEQIALHWRNAALSCEVTLRRRARLNLDLSGLSDSAGYDVNVTPFLTCDVQQAISLHTERAIVKLPASRFTENTYYQACSTFF
ncbi:MAG: hypothetical protein V4805_05945 [Pseudomonadota bacterium]